MNRITAVMAAVVAAVVLASCSPERPPVSLRWEINQNGPEAGRFSCTFTLTNHLSVPLDTNWTIYYAQIACRPLFTEGEDVSVERVKSSFHRLFPRASFAALQPGESRSFTIRYAGTMTRETWFPRGAYIVLRDADGNELKPQSVPLEVVPFSRPEQWLSPAGGFPYADGEYMYRQNAEFRELPDVEWYELLPTPKQVSCECTDVKRIGRLPVRRERVDSWDAAGRAELFAGANPETLHESYLLQVNLDGILLQALTDQGLFYAEQTLNQLRENAGSRLVRLPLTIADWPDAPYRGQHFDIARNYLGQGSIYRMIDLISAYKLNTLHLHLVDDEAWRLEISGLPELTDMASRRGHDLTETLCLYPFYSGGWDYTDPTSTSNGYLTRQDFIDILHYARDRFVTVIPEVDMPGHSRAAIKAMEVRYQHYINSDPARATEFLLSDPADSSQYNSAQNYNDNVLNVALPSTYRFIEKVIDEIAGIYREASVEMPVFNIGGDEVPAGAWGGNRACLALMEQEGMNELRDLKDYFVLHVLPMVEKHGAQVAGWEETTMLEADHTPNPLFRNSHILSHCWNTLTERNADVNPYRLVNAGVPIVLSNACNCYLDFSYSNHHQERGLVWGGYVDEFNTFDLTPYAMYKSVRRNLRGDTIDIQARSQALTPLVADSAHLIRGVQGQMWAEVLTDMPQVERNLFPRLLGLVERGWNMHTPWEAIDDPTPYINARARYNALIAFHELPRLAARGVNYNVAIPGIHLTDGLLHMNARYPGAQIRYTTDGSEPTPKSPLWTAPVPLPDGTTLVKARAYYCGVPSQTTILLISN